MRIQYWAQDVPKHYPSITSYYSPATFHIRATPPATELETAGTPSESLATWLCLRLLRDAGVKSARESEGGEGADKVCDGLQVLMDAMLRSLLESSDIYKALELLLTLETGPDAKVVCMYVCMYVCVCVCVCVC